MAAARAAAPAAAPALEALEAAAAPARDVLLFRHGRGRLLRAAGLCCAGQGLLWAHLAHWAFTGLRPVPGPGAGPDDPLRPRDNKWRFAFTASCLTLGSMIVAAGCAIPLRVVREVTLLRGGAAVTISTHGPLGLGRGATFTVPLRDVSCRAHRSQAAAAVPLRVRGRRFFFLLDKRGQLPHPRLFDLTVGAYRKL